MATRIKELHKYALGRPPSAEMMADISDNKFCPQCGGIEVLYVGENISVRSR